MKFARYWEQAWNESGSINCWGWSYESQEEAQAMARERLERLLANFKAGRASGKSGTYYGVSRPPREEAIREIRPLEADEPVAIVSRNSYGCLVLNAEGFAMIDLDLPPKQNMSGLMQWLVKLFEGREAVKEPADELKARVDEWMMLAKRQGRLYRTAAGFRLILTDKMEDPASETFQRHMEDLQADPLFRQLCKGQETFRARLTPKPWRMEAIGQPPTRYPWSQPGEKESFDLWLKRYEEASPAFAVCEQVEEYGGQPSDPLITRLLELHDEYVLNPGKPLA